MYWADEGMNRIQCANLDGSNVQDLVIQGGGSDPRGIALDLVGGKMYWADKGWERIQCANLDGSNVQTLVRGLRDPSGIAISIIPPVHLTTPQPDPPEQPGNTGGTPILSVSTAAPLTEATLHDGMITLTLSGGTYESSSWRIRDAVAASGISGVTVDVDRVSDTEVTVELTYDGNMSANGTLTLTVGAGAIKDYDGGALTGQISVSAVTESHNRLNSVSIERGNFRRKCGDAHTQWQEI